MIDFHFEDQQGDEVFVHDCKDGQALIATQSRCNGERSNDVILTREGCLDLAAALLDAARLKKKRDND